jgi:hypothetical protein
VTAEDAGDGLPELMDTQCQEQQRRHPH